MVIEIRKQKNKHCSFLGCKRAGFAVLVTHNKFHDVGSVAFYPECKQCLKETVTMTDWTETAKAQWKELCA